MCERRFLVSLVEGVEHPPSSREGPGAVGHEGIAEREKRLRLLEGHLGTDTRPSGHAVCGCRFDYHIPERLRAGRLEVYESLRQGSVVTGDHRHGPRVGPVVRMPPAIHLVA